MNETPMCREGAIVYIDGKPELELVCELPDSHNGGATFIPHKDGNFEWSTY